MSEPIKKFYGNLDLLALYGSRITHDENGYEVVQIPIDLAKLRRSGSHVYLPFFMFSKKIFDYDYVITRNQTKQEREKKLKTEILGNAIDVKSTMPMDRKSTELPPPAAEYPSNEEMAKDDTPF